MKRFFRYALWAVVALVVLVAVAMAGLRLWAPVRQAAADRGWAESFESMDALVSRYPSAPDSPAALQLASLTEPLGISLRPSVEPSTERFKSLVSFVRDQETKADDGKTDAAPEEVAQLLSRMRVDLEAVEVHLLGGEPIVWAIDLRKGLETAQPSLQGHRLLESALLARALEAARKGDRRAAQRSLEASWKLNLTMRQRPDLVNQLGAIALGEVHNGVLRRVPEPPVEWADRQVSHDWRGALLRSLQVDTLRFTTAVRRERPASLFLDLNLADYSEAMRRMAVELRSQDLCAVDVEALSRRTEEAIPRSNILARVAMPGFVHAWATAGEAAVGDELTRLVILAKAQARATGAGAPLPATVQSSACAGLIWVVRTLPGGDIQIEPGRNPFHDAKRGSLLAFRVHRAPR